MTRRSAAVVTLVLAAALGGTAAGTWVTARAWTALEERTLTVSGLDASPVLGATALLLAGAGLALAAAGRRAARVVGVAVVAASALAAVSTGAVLAGPAASARAAARAQLGVARVTDAACTALPWLTLVAAGAGLVVGTWTVLAAGRRSWAPEGAGASRYRRPGQDGARSPAEGRGRTGPDGTPPDSVAAWDALTRGEDPT